MRYRMVIGAPMDRTLEDLSDMIQFLDERGKAEWSMDSMEISFVWEPIVDGALPLTKFFRDQFTFYSANVENDAARGLEAQRQYEDIEETIRQMGFDLHGVDRA